MARSDSRLQLAIRLRRMMARGRPLRVRRRRRPRRPRRPIGIELDYLAVLLHVLDQARAVVRRVLLPELGMLARQAAPRHDSTRADGYVDVFESLIAQIVRELDGEAMDDPEARAVMQAFGRRIEDYNSREVSAAIKDQLGMDVVGAVPGLEDKLAAFARQNVQLIGSIREDYLHDVEQTVLRNFREGRRAEEIAGELEDRFGVAQNRAALIARDQVGKLNGELNQDRQTNLGITSYTWHNVGDERVAGNPNGKYPNAEPSHWDREGNVYSWDDPPEGGHPGQRPQCRCWAEPNLEALLEE